MCLMNGQKRREVTFDVVVFEELHISTHVFDLLDGDHDQLINGRELGPVESAVQNGRAHYSN